ncbi:hypothetical protein PENSPDRAFT_648930 [Peniophora sp. CONT]|nr:hypothetical protein PENSPDRAFT_648930 [Peniophora sp. CONT]
MAPRTGNGGKAASSSRPSRAAAPKSFADENDPEGGDTFDFGVDSSPADDPAHWLGMMRDMKSKTKGAQNPASVQRTRQLVALVKNSRAQAGEFVKDTNAYLDALVATYAVAPKEEGASPDWAPYFQAGARHAKALNDSVACAIKLTPRSDLEGGNLPQRREDDVERACTRLEAYPVQREKARARQLRAFKEELDKEIEHQQLVVDARAMIKSYQGLVRRA